MTDWERVFRDACDEAGCAYDNEALLQAISDLKRPSAVAQCSPDCGAKAYVERAIASYIGDPADNQFQKGFLAALEVVRDEAFSVPSTDPRCTCAAIVNPSIPHARFCPLSSTDRGGK